MEALDGFCQETVEGISPESERPEARNFARNRLKDFAWNQLKILPGISLKEFFPESRRRQGSKCKGLARNLSRDCARKQSNLVAWSDVGDFSQNQFMELTLNQIEVKFRYTSKELQWMGICFLLSVFLHDLPVAFAAQLTPNRNYSYFTSHVQI